jgi:hydroxymethylbilane synthase
MNRASLRLVSRGSALAVRQAEIVMHCLKQHWKNTLDIRAMYVKHDGTSLQKDRFVQSVRAYLADGLADVAVHSLKDVPLEHTVIACLPREHPEDVWVGKVLPDITQALHVGTNSLRRQQQGMRYAPLWRFSSFSGNINTRLQRYAQTFDGIIIAKAALTRLYDWNGHSPCAFEHQQHYVKTFDVSTMVPAVGQGVIAIEGSQAFAPWFAPFHCHRTHACWLSERSLAHALQANCHTAIGIHTPNLDNPHDVLVFNHPSFV